MEQIRKVVGKTKTNERPLKRLYELNQFLLRFSRKVAKEPNVKPIRKTVGRSSKF